MPAAEDQKGLLLLFTGHRIDSPNRARPRFPATSERTARALITEAVRAEIARHPTDSNTPEIRGISSGANGGDILFLEVCAEFEVPTEMYLAKELEAFIEASVGGAEETWIRRFRALAEAMPVHVLRDDAYSSENVWQRTNQWMLETALADPNRQTTVIALWDGQRGDGPGGTEDMAARARAAGASFVHIETTALTTERAPVRSKR